MDDDDVEARSAKMSAVRAVLFGPMFPVLLHRTALANAGRSEPAWILAELAANAVSAALVVFVLPFPALRCHLAAMAIGHCLTAFFAVWTVHHDCDRYHFIARTLRSRWKSAVAFAMYFHVEHHLYPPRADVSAPRPRRAPRSPRPSSRRSARSNDTLAAGRMARLRAVRGTLRAPGRS